MTSLPVVRVVPFQPHCFAFGGFEVQMLAAMHAARKAGADVKPLDPWSRDSDFDVLHLWGCDIVHLETAKWARLDGKKLVMSALYPYPSIQARLRYWASLFIGSARFRKPMLSWLSCITVVNQQQARYAIDILGIPEHLILIVPNIVEDIFFEPPEKNIVSQIKVKDYVICTGNICLRKNQLSLIRACQRIGLSLLLIGDTLIGEEAYGNEIEAALNGISDMQWIRGLPPNSPDLVSAYHNSLIFALPSFNEQQPISALEAAAAGKPLLLSNRNFAKQELYTNAALAEPGSVLSIESALREIMKSTRDYKVPINILNKCRREIVGRLYFNAYGS